MTEYPRDHMVTTAKRLNALLFRIKQRLRAKTRWEKNYAEELIKLNAEELAEAFAAWKEETE